MPLLSLPLPLPQYITGRIKLSSCDNSKAIKEASKKGGKDLEFIFDDKSKEILVNRVPPVYGVRCGAAVKGFLTPASKTMRSISWPSKKSKAKGSTCTLTDLIQENGINRKQDTLVFKVPVTYCTHWVKVDSKEYGVPQTRQRTYMFVWQPDKEGDVNDDLGQYWEALVKHLKSPVRHSLEAFILQVDHDIIRVFREGKVVNKFVCLLLTLFQISLLMWHVFTLLILYPKI